MDLISLLHRASQTVEEQYRTMAGKDALTPRQVTVLQTIKSSPQAPSQTDIVAATGIDRSTLADLVRRLVNAGLVTRRRTKRDAREYELKLTNAGLAALEGARRQAAAAESTVIGRLPAKQHKSFLDSLHKLATTEA